MKLNWNLCWMKIIFVDILKIAQKKNENENCVIKLAVI